MSRHSLIKLAEVWLVWTNIIDHGLLMIPWDVCILPNEEGGLWLIDVVVQGKPARFWQQNDCDVLGRFSHLADLIEIISSPHLFQFRGSSMLKSIWSTWKCVAKCVYWIYTSTGCHGYLVIQPSWCWKGHGQCFLEIPQYQASRLSRQGILFWKDLHLILEGLAGFIFQIMVWLEGVSSWESSPFLR